MPKTRRPRGHPGPGLLRPAVRGLAPARPARTQVMTCVLPHCPPSPPPLPARPNPLPARPDPSACTTPPPPPLCTHALQPATRAVAAWCARSPCQGRPAWACGGRLTDSLWMLAESPPFARRPGAHGGLRGAFGGTCHGGTRRRPVTHSHPNTRPKPLCACMPTPPNTHTPTRPPPHCARVAVNTATRCTPTCPPFHLPVHSHLPALAFVSLYNTRRRGGPRRAGRGQTGRDGRRNPPTHPALSAQRHCRWLQAPRCR